MLLKITVRTYPVLVIYFCEISMWCGLTRPFKDISTLLIFTEYLYRSLLGFFYIISLNSHKCDVGTGGTDTFHKYLGTNNSWEKQVLCHRSLVTNKSWNQIFGLAKFRTNTFVYEIKRCMCIIFFLKWNLRHQKFCDRQIGIGDCFLALGIWIGNWDWV